MKEALKRLKSDEIRKRALQIFKYQNYKTIIALERMEPKVGRAAFEAGVVYIKKGKRTAPLSNVLKEAIDTLKKECIQPLRPSREEERKWREPIYQGKDAIPPVSMLTEVKKKLTVMIEYGVEVNNSIRLCKSEEEARVFLDGVRFVGSQASLVEVKKRRIV